MTTLLVALALTIAAAVHDLRSRTVPDRYSVAIAALGTCASLAKLSGVSPVSAAGGALVGIVAGLILYLCMGFGGADAKLLAALGVWVGPGGMAAILVWTALAGMVLSVIALLRGRRDLAYVPAIAAGLAVYMAWPNAMTVLVV